MEEPEVSREDLITAIRALAYLVHDEYPSKYSLTEIAETWGDHCATEDDIEALWRVEVALGLSPAEVLADA